MTIQVEKLPIEVLELPKKIIPSLIDFSIIKDLNFFLNFAEEKRSIISANQISWWTNFINDQLTYINSIDNSKDFISLINSKQTL